MEPRQEMRMETLFQITYRNMDSSPALEADIRRRAEALQKHAPRVLSGKVTVQAPAQHHRKGGPFTARVELQLERGDLITAGGSGEVHGHEDVYAAVRDVFLAARRQLDEGPHGHGRPTGRGTPQSNRIAVRQGGVR
jgi:hypothetical protein